MYVARFAIRADKRPSVTCLMAPSATAGVNHYSTLEIWDLIFHMKDRLPTFFFPGHLKARGKDYHSDVHFKLIIFSPVANARDRHAFSLSPFFRLAFYSVFFPHSHAQAIWVWIVLNPVCSATLSEFMHSPCMCRAGLRFSKIFAYSVDK